MQKEEKIEGDDIEEVKKKANDEEDEKEEG